MITVENVSVSSSAIFIALAIKHTLILIYQTASDAILINSLLGGGEETDSYHEDMMRHLVKILHPIPLNCIYVNC